MCSLLMVHALWLLALLCLTADGHTAVACAKDDPGCKDRPEDVPATVFPVGPLPEFVDGRPTPEQIGDLMKSALANMPPDTASAVTNVIDLLGAAGIDLDDIGLGSLITAPGVPVRPETSASTVSSTDNTTSGFISTSPAVSGDEAQQEQGTADVSGVRLTEAQKYELHITNVYRQLSDFRTLMEVRQSEIDEVMTHLLPAAQRSAMVFSASATRARNKLDRLSTEIYNIASEMPGGDMAKAQADAFAAILSIQNMQASIQGPLIQSRVMPTTQGQRGCCESYGMGAMMSRLPSTYADDVESTDCDDTMLTGGGKVHHIGMSCCAVCVKEGRSWQSGICNPTDNCDIMDVACSTTLTMCEEPDTADPGFVPSAQALVQGGAAVMTPEAGNSNSKTHTTWEIVSTDQMLSQITAHTRSLSDQIQILQKDIGFGTVSSRSRPPTPSQFDHFDDDISNLLSDDDLPDPALLQISLKEEPTAVMADIVLEELIESFKTAKVMLREGASQARSLWSDVLDELSAYSQSLMAEVEYHQTQATESLAYARQLKSYVRKNTKEQYETLAWVHNMTSSLQHFGNNKHVAISTRTSVLPLILQLFHVMTLGDHPFVAPDVDGCDGKGTSVDACGVCGGQGTTCLSCNGIENGPETLDVCGVCGDGKGLTCRYFCDGVSNSGASEDLCGVCGGDDLSCAGCDDIPHSPTQFDTCGTCGGDGSACNTYKNCQDVSCEVEIVCPMGKRVTSLGFKGCCFDPTTDCV